MHIKGPETRQCPSEFQARLTRMFGKNEFGDPYFRVVWGQSEFHRMGNRWRDRFGNERSGYRLRYLAHAMACWVILRWKSPKEYSSPDVFYQRTFDDYTGLYILGEYPWRGRYEIMQALIRKEMVNNKLVVEHFPLSHALIDRIIPLMLQFQQLSSEEQKAAQEFAKEQEHKKQVAELADKMMDSLPMTYGPVSFSRQGCRTSLLDKKIVAIQKQWDKLSKGGKKPVFLKGIHQGQKPMQLN